MYNKTTSNGWNTTAGAGYSHHRKIKATFQSRFARLRGSDSRHAVLDCNSASSAKWQNSRNELLSHGQPQRTDCRPIHEKAGNKSSLHSLETYSYINFAWTHCFWPKCGAAIERSLKISTEACYFSCFAKLFIPNTKDDAKLKPFSMSSLGYKETHNRMLKLSCYTWKSHALTKEKIQAFFHTGMNSKRAIFFILNLLQSCLCAWNKGYFLTSESACPNATRKNRKKPSISGGQCTDSGRPLATQDHFWLNSVLHAAQVEALEGPVPNLQCAMTMIAAHARGGLKPAVLKNRHASRAASILAHCSCIERNETKGQREGDQAWNK